MLLVLLLGIFYFGRIFSAGITIETAARNGAEAAALERLRDKPPTDSSLLGSYYQNLHVIAAAAVCSEGRSLPDANQNASGNCTNPIVRACVHDGQDPSCGFPIPGFDAPVPSECTNLASGAPSWTNASGGDEASHYVEVRVCYAFRGALSLSLPFAQGINAGDVWLQRTRSFVLDCPPGSVAAC
jgi:hypothetical protein